MRRLTRKRAALVSAGSAVTVVAGLLVAVMVNQASAESRRPPGGNGDAAAVLSQAGVARGATPEQLAVTGRDRLSTVRTVTDPDGSTHTRYSRTYNGLRVIGGDLVVHSAPGGEFESASVGLGAALTVDTNPSVSAAQARERARAAFRGTVTDSPAAQGSAARTDGRLALSTAAQGVREPELIVDASSGTGVLAYDTVVSGMAPDGQTPSRLHVISDAHSGEVRWTYDEVHTVGGTGHGVYEGTVPIGVRLNSTYGDYDLIDPDRGNGATCDFKNLFFGSCEVMYSTDTVFGDGTNDDPQSAGVDAHYGAAMAFDYFKNTHGRNGIKGDGKGILSAVHYGDDYENAFFDPSFWDDGSAGMVYGDGAGNNTPFTALDIAAHEMTHGITGALVPGDLNYWGESGGLNEATSDIFGTMVEFFANNPADPADYTLGEELGTPLRFMYQPSLDDPYYAGALKSYDCWQSGINTTSTDPHFTSGIGNHFFFMLAEGSGATAYGTSPVCAGAPAVTGIGYQKAAKIWYRALDVYFTSTTLYVNPGNPANTARAATLAAAADLHGVCSPEYTAVDKAWTAVNVTGFVGCDDTLPTAAGAYVSLAPARILDTREGNGTAGNKAGKVPGRGTITLQVTGRGGVPASGVGAVVLNVTVANPDGPGFITVYPSGEPLPNASNLNFVGGQIVPNLVTVKLGSGGKLSLTNSSNGGVHLIADVAGYYLAGTGTEAGTFTPLSPSRLLDSRDGNGMPGGKAARIGSYGTVDLQVAGRGGVPAATDVSAVVLNVTVTEPTTNGFVTVYPAGQALPNASNLNYTAGKVVPNLVTVLLGTDGKVSLRNSTPGSAHLVADVAGYYRSGTPTVEGAFVSLAPSRILDTREANGVPTKAKVPPYSEFNLQVTGRGNVAAAAEAVVLNVTVADPTTVGFVTVYPAGAVRPNASNLNFTAGLIVPNLAITRLGIGGKLTFSHQSPGTTNLIADVAGYFL